MRTLELKEAFTNEYVTIRYSAEENFIWNEWRGVIPSRVLREAVLLTCEFVLANKIAFILSDYSRMSAPLLDDQVWISNHFSDLLHHSRLRKVANLMAQDLFQQVAIQTIYDMASEVPLHCESRDFVSKEEALEWLFLEKRMSA